MSSFDAAPQTPNASIWPTAIKWGLIAGVIGVVITMVFYNMGMMEPDNTSGSIISTVVSIALGVAMIFLGLKAYRDTANNGQLTLGRGVFWSLGYGLIAAVIGIIFSYVFFTFLAPDFIQNAMDLQFAAMEEQGMGDDEIEAAESMMGIFMNPIAFAISGALSGLVLSVVEGLVVSLILKTR